MQTFSTKMLTIWCDPFLKHFHVCFGSFDELLIFVIAVKYCSYKVRPSIGLVDKKPDALKQHYRVEEIL